MITDSKRLSKIHSRLKPYIHHTPILTSTYFDQLIGASVFFKCEAFQRTGSFKMRGASNAILSLSDEEKSRGVVAHSSGNFAQAVALASREIGVDAHIVMPNNASTVKKEAVKNYEAQVYECQPTIESREKMTAEISKKLGATMLHPSNQIEVILGNATIALEACEDVDALDYIIAPVGGGGMAAGIGLGIQHMNRSCRLIGAEPSNADDAHRSLESGEIQKNATADTIADGLRTHLGSVNFPILQKTMNSIITVTEEEIVQAMRMIWTRLKVVIEPSAGVGVAAAIKGKSQFREKKVCIVLCGGNVDIDHLPW